MTENEAIKEIETSLELAEMFTPNKEREKEIKAYKIAIQALEEIQQYRAIGTVEEVRMLKEKNEPKRLLTREEKYPQNYGIYSTEDRWCPCCKGLIFTSDWSVYKQQIMYKRTRCGCGQKLDWEGGAE